MKRIILIILFLMEACAVRPVPAQDWDFGFDFMGSRKGSTSFPLPNFSIDTTNAGGITPPTPFTSSYLRFSGSPTARGQFARCLGGTSEQYGLGLPNNTTDSFEIKITVKFTADGRHIWGKFSGGTGWFMTIGAALGTRFVEFYTPSEGSRAIDTITLGDTTWHTYLIYHWKASTTLDAYADGIRTVHDITYTTGISTHASSFALGVWGAINNLSDTTQLMAGSYFAGGIAMPTYVKRYSGNRDTTYTLGMNGYGQEVWIDVSSMGTHVKGWKEYDRADYTDFLPASLHMQLGDSPSLDPKDPLWVNVGTKPTYIDTVKGGVANFSFTTDNYRMVERYTNGETVWETADSTWIVVTGTFNEINWTSSRAYGDSAKGVAKYNINTGKWTAFNNAQYPTGSIYTAVQYDTGVVVGGDFTGFQTVALTNGIAFFDGTNWMAIDSGFNTSVSCVRVRVLKDTLYAGGQFTKSGNTTLGGIAKLVNNVWTGFGTGTNGTIFDMIIFNNRLIIGGNFTTANGVACNSMAEWNGTTFVPFGNGIKNGASAGTIYCFAIYKNELYIGGTFDTAKGVVCSNLVKYDGTTWTAVGTSITRGTQSEASVIDMKVDSTYNHLYIKGQFSMFNGKIASCGVTYDGTNIQPLPADDKRPEGILITDNGTADIRYWIMGDQEGVYGWNVGAIYELTPPR